MSRLRAPVERPVLVERYVTRIGAHLTHFSHGHDPMGHLFAVERLARSARAEWWETQRESEPEHRRR
jgi:hypothetical protein